MSNSWPCDPSSVFDRNGAKSTKISLSNGATEPRVFSSLSVSPCSINVHKNWYKDLPKQWSDRAKGLLQSLCQSLLYKRTQEPVQRSLIKIHIQYRECKRAFCYKWSRFIYYLSDVTVLSKYPNTLQTFSDLLVRDVVYWYWNTRHRHSSCDVCSKTRASI